jgi:pyruvate kinase
MEPEKLFIAQKWMIQSANKKAVPVFIQSQVLESLVPANAAVSRQEAHDISNAVLDGADVFILSHETSVGANPINATILLAKSIAEAENVYDHE